MQLFFGKNSMHDRHGPSSLTHQGKKHPVSPEFSAGTLLILSVLLAGLCLNAVLLLSLSLRTSESAFQAVESNPLLASPEAVRDSGTGSGSLQSR
jgi:hypothetical protein